MSGDTLLHHRAFCADHRPAMLLLSPYVASIAFQIAGSAETQRQRRSFKPGDPIRHPQSQNPSALTASAARLTPIKSP